MSFTLVTSHRLEDLFDVLVERLVAAPLPPLCSETILVPGQGLARWLELRLAERHGIAAGFDLPFLGAFLHRLTEQSRQARDGQDGDVFARDVLVWRLWQLLSSHPGRHPDAGTFGPASEYLHDDPDGRKRLQLCTRLAACFDDYQLYRDDVLQAFAANGTTTKTRGRKPHTGNVAGYKASPHAEWQAQLWRALLADAGYELPAGRRRKRVTRQRTAAQTPLLFADLAEPSADRAADQAHHLARLRERLQDAAWRHRHLPPRLTVFGATTMPPALLSLLHDLARHLPVQLYVPQPTPHYYGHLRRRGASQGDNALLARFGSESREFADLLQQLEERAPPGVPVERVEPSEQSEQSEATMPAEVAELRNLLDCLQRDVVAAFDRGEPGAERYPLQDGDASLRVHDCHSPQREFEVVRDQIFAAFDADSTLQAHDVLVLVPDIDRYAPYAHAVFGPVAHRLPFHVADRSPARELPVCRSLLMVLDLARERLTLADVLHLLENPAVQRRFGLFGADLPVLRHLCHRAGIRWGLDGQSRKQRFGLPAFDDNSWRQGLDRLLLGTLTGPEQDLIAGLLPVGDSTDSRGELCARFITFTHAVFTAVESLLTHHGLSEWADRVDALTEALFLAQDGDDEEALQQLQRSTVTLRRLAQLAGHDQPVSLAVVHDWLRETLAQGAGSRFLGGSVTIAAMLPMRAVPVRCLFLCGLDDESYPRRDRPAPFDLIAAAPRPGDRNRRLDDRQLFLDLLLSVRDQLHLTYVGHSAKDNSEGAPSVVLSELLEHIDRTCSSPEPGRRPSSMVTVTHPLQPWSRHYHRGGDERLFTYARLPAPADIAEGRDLPWCPADLVVVPTEPEPSIALERLLEFWWHPCRFFLRQAMRVRVRAEDDRDEDAEPFVLDHLTRYKLQDAAVRRIQRGDAPPADALRLARAQGVLPIGAQGEAAFRETDAATQQFLERARPHLDTDTRRVDLSIAGHRLVGAIDGFGKQELVYMRTSKLKAKDRLKAWLMHLVVTVQRHQQAAERPPEAGRQPERPWPRTTLVLSSDGSWRYDEVPLDDAARYLTLLVESYLVGQSRPLPFFEYSSFATGEALDDSVGKRETPDSALRRAAARWRGDSSGAFYRPGDLDDQEVALCMRGRDPFAGGADGEFFRLASSIWPAAISYLHPVD